MGSINLQHTFAAAISAAISEESVKEIWLIDGTKLPDGIRCMVHNDYITVFSKDEECIYPISSIFKIRIR